MLRLDPLTTRAIIAVAVPIVVQCIGLACMVVLFHRSSIEAQKEANSLDITHCARCITVATASTIRTSVIHASFQGLFGKEEMEEEKAQLDREIKNLEQLSGDEPARKASVERARALPEDIAEIVRLTQKFAPLKDHEPRHDMTRESELARGEENELEGEIWKVSQSKAPHLIELVENIAGVERQLNQINSAAKTRDRALLRQAMLAFVIANFITAALFSLYLTGNITKRLKRVSENTEKMARREPLNEPVSGDDEIAALDHFLHRVDLATREALEKERALVLGAADMILSVSEDLTIQSANPAALKISGCAPGMGLAEIVVDKTKDSLKAQMDEIRQRPDGGGTFEAALSHKDENRSGTQGGNRPDFQSGSRSDMLVSVHWSDIDLSYFCVLHDITEAKEIERLKESFVQMVSHDLRSPLMSITGSIELLIAGAYGELPQSAKDELASAEANVRRLIKLINDLLDMEKLRSGKINLDLSTCSIQAVIDRSVEAVKALAREKEVSIVCEPSAGKASVQDGKHSVQDGSYSLEADSYSLEADEDKLVQVVINLLGNAIKFTGQGDAVVVSTRNQGSELEITVSDTGPGIDESDRANIFKPFEQVKGSGQEDKGSGLGLAICKAIVEAHGGEIGVDSIVGEGSTFWVRLPRIREHG